MRLFTLFVVSWMIGVLAFWLVGSIVVGRVMGSGDLSAAAVYSGVIFVFTAPVIYLPAILWIRHRKPGRYTNVIMIAASVIHTVTATALLLSQFGGFRLQLLMDSEAFAFYVLFGIAGVVLSVGTLKA